MPVIVSGAGGASEKKIEEIIKSRGVVKSVQRGITSAFNLEAQIENSNVNLYEWSHISIKREGVHVKPTKIEISPIDPDKSIVLVGNPGSALKSNNSELIIAPYGVTQLTSNELSIFYTAEMEAFIDSNNNLVIGIKNTMSEVDVIYKHYFPDIIEYYVKPMYDSVKDVPLEEYMLFPSLIKVPWQVIEFY